MKSSRLIFCATLYLFAFCRIALADAEAKRQFSTKWRSHDARNHPEDKSSKSTIEAFKKTFGPATTKNMEKVSNDLAKKLAALRDDGSKGYWAHPTTDAKLSAMGLHPNRVPAYTHLGDKNIWVNTQHQPGWSNYVLAWAIDHEAGHSAAGLRDLGYKVDSWRYSAISNPTRLLNADSSTDFVHQVSPP